MRMVRTGSGLDHREFIAAEPREWIDLAQQAADPLGNRAEHAVAGRVPESVVDLLEGVEVKQMQCEALTGAPRVGEGLHQAVGEQAAVRKTG